MRLQTARLREPETQKILALEAALGSRIVAVEPVEEFAELPPEGLRRLAELEEELGVALVAYRALDPFSAGEATYGWASEKVRHPLKRLTAEQLKVLRDAELDLALILLCYEVRRTG